MKNVTVLRSANLNRTSAHCISPYNLIDTIQFFSAQQNTEIEVEVLFALM